MQPIRTKKGKLFGMLNVTTYVLNIKDGSNTRLIQIPPAGLTLQYIAGGGQPETINIPPRAQGVTAA